MDTAAANFRLFGKLVVPVSEEFESNLMEESTSSPRSGVSIENERDFSVTPIKSEEFKKRDTAAASFRLFGKWVGPVSEEFESVMMEESTNSTRQGVSIEIEKFFSITPINSTCQPEVLAEPTFSKPHRYEPKVQARENNLLNVQVTSSLVHKISISSLTTHRTHASHPQTRDIPFSWQDINARLPASNNDRRNMSIAYSSPVARLAAANKRHLLPGTQGFNLLPGLHAHARQEQYREQGRSKTSSGGNEFEQS